MDDITFADGASLRVSADGTHLERIDGKNFFWLGDTAWLLNKRLLPDEMEEYLDARAAAGFTVLQVMVIHSLSMTNHQIPMTNAYGSPAAPEGLRALARLEELPRSADGRGFWDTLEFAVTAAGARGMYVALVPIWGSCAKEIELDAVTAALYGRQLANRFRQYRNVIWMNGGDIRGSDFAESWRALGDALRDADPGKLITFHPFGRCRSATWFHGESWLDFNMFQSGHRDYDQRPPEFEGAGEAEWRGEDNWRYVLDDLSLEPRKPTLDGEPSYEDIPHGLHDPNQPRWTADDCRRYAYWALFAGAFGHTYGHNAVMQFHTMDEEHGSYGVRQDWRAALGSPGAAQMRHVVAFAQAMGRKPLLWAVDLLAQEGGERYRRVLAATSDEAIAAYSYSGGSISFAPLIRGTSRAWLFDPRSGSVCDLGSTPSNSFFSIDLPGPACPGNDWIVVVESADARPNFAQRVRQIGGIDA